MPTPTGYTEWGYLGGLIFIVVAFLTYLIRRDNASAKREKSMQDFFGRLFSENKDATSDLVQAIQHLIEQFQDHDKKTAEAIATMKERTQPVNKPRKVP
jgi:hypothetical protein